MIDEMGSSSFHQILPLLLLCGPVYSEVITLESGSSKTITSPKYPRSYPDDEFRQWDIRAPLGRRILVTFIDFALDRTDTMTLFEFCDIHTSYKYTGETLYPSFLSLGNRICIEFESSRRDARRGFNLSLTYHEDGDSVHLVNDTLPHVGIVELRSADRWISVCGDEVPRKTAEVMCRELGYPGVKEISYKNISCNGCPYEGRNQICAKAPSCEDHTYRLMDCDLQNHTSLSMTTLEIKCWEPGFLGCYNIDSQMNETLMTGSTSACVSTFRDNTTEGCGITIILQDGQCFCTTVEKLNLINFSSDETGLSCTQEGDRDGQSQSSLPWKLVYNESVGFCEHLGTPTGGWWRYDNTWFASTAHLTCAEGYRLKGNGTRQCVPGVSPYVPVWSHTDSTCEQLSNTNTMDTGYSEGINVMAITEETSGMKQGQHDGQTAVIAIHVVCGFLLMRVISDGLPFRQENTFGHSQDSEPMSQPQSTCKKAMSSSAISDFY